MYIIIVDVVLSEYVNSDPEKSVTREEAPDRVLRKSARLQRGSKAASSGKGGMHHRFDIFLISYFYQ